MKSFIVTRRAVVLLVCFLPMVAAAQTFAPCSRVTGAKFNTEPKSGMPHLGFVAPKSNPSVDFIPGGGIGGSDLIIGGAWDFEGRLDGLTGNAINAWGPTQSGYYVHRQGTGCEADFSGPLPPIPNFDLLAFDQTSIAVDSTRKLVYAADVRAWPTTPGGTGLFKTTAANMDNPSICPSGTHNNDANGNPTIAETCWPIRVLIGQEGPDDTNFEPEIRADERASGTGAGDLYIAYTNFSVGFGTVNLVVCPYTFHAAQDCSAPIAISAGEFGPSFPHLAIRPDGIVTITYTNFSFNGLGQDIKYVACIPAGAPNPPLCSAPTLITTEQQPMADTANTATHFWNLYTNPYHDYRFNASTGAYEEFVTWVRCKQPFTVYVGNPENGNYFDQCPDADIVMTYSPTDSAGNALGWSPVLPVNTEVHDQLMPALEVDHQKNIVHIVYYTAQWDAQGELLWLVENQILPGSYSLGPVVALTTAPIDQSVDFANGTGDFVDLGVGLRIGVAARNGRAYVHFIGTNFPGNLGGRPVSHQTNQLTRIAY